MSEAKKIAVIGGDGTGPEVAAEGVKVLKAVAKLEGIKFELTHLDWGGDRYLKTGEALPADGLDELRKFDAILLGAVGHPDVTPGILERKLLLGPALPPRPVHQPAAGEAVPRRRDAAARTRARRTSTSSSSARTPRTCTAASAASCKKGTPDEVATQTAVYTRKGCERCIRWAFELHPQAQQPEGQEAHAGRQDERAHLRPRPVVADVPGRRPRSTPTSRPTTTTSTPAACGW